jgi:NADH:ubiquinone oxidoreductase subunit 6 (subunit J)
MEFYMSTIKSYDEYMAHRFVPNRIGNTVIHAGISAVCSFAAIKCVQAIGSDTGTVAHLIASPYVQAFTVASFALLKAINSYCSFRPAGNSGKPSGDQPGI